MAACLPLQRSHSSCCRNNSPSKWVAESCWFGPVPAEPSTLGALVAEVDSVAPGSATPAKDALKVGCNLTLGHPEPTTLADLQQHPG